MRPKNRLFGLLGGMLLSFGSAAFAGSNSTKDASVLQTAVFGMGCFWKSQYVFSHVPGVVRTTVGYTGGKVKNPSYEQVCSHTTGHVEAVKVDFDPEKVSYRTLLELFFARHDPTTLNRQGPDVGTNYRSAIFYTNPEQKAEANAFKAKLEAAHRFKSLIVTTIEPLTEFYDAESYHQEYFVKHGISCE